MSEKIASSVVYYISDRPQVAWAWDLEERNLEFLRALEPEYFAHVARTQAPLLARGDATAQYAAAGLRIAFGQAIETLFALLGALAQAPDAPIGWVLGYRNHELSRVAALLMSDEGLGELSAWSGRANLEDLAQLVFDRVPWAPTKKRTVVQGYERLWRLWGESLLDDVERAECNSFKHGTRAGLGGTTVAVGREETPGVMAAPDAIVALGGSVFGSTFYRAFPLEGNLHIYPRRQSRNWSGDALWSGLELIAMSARNVISCLRILGGDDPSVCRFDTPEDPSDFGLPLAPVVGVTSFGLDLKLDSSNIERLSREQVAARLRRPG